MSWPMCYPCVGHLCYLCLGTAQEPRPTKNDTPRSRRVFRPTDRPFAPLTSNLERHGGVLRLVERVAVTAVLELVEDSAGQFGGLYS